MLIQFTKDPPVDITLITTVTDHILQRYIVNRSKPPKPAVLVNNQYIAISIY